MAQDLTIGTRAARPAPRLPVIVTQLWRTLTKDLFDTYRPERHYMRGPGPKWHAKHDFAMDTKH